MNRSSSTLHKIAAILIILVLSGQSAVLAQDPFGGTSSVVQQDAVTPTPFPVTPTAPPEPTPTSSIDLLTDTQSEEFTPNPQAGVSYYVDIATGDNSSSCTSVSAPCKNIQEAVNKASNGDIIRVASGTYFFSNNPSPNVLINNGKNLTISGGWNDNFTLQNSVSILDGENLRNGYLHTGGTVILENFIIQNSVSSNSGAVYVVGGNLTINRSTIKNNRATNNGAGVFVYSGIVKIINSTISGNTATGSGGGIHAVDGLVVTVNIINSTIVNNTANTGGGIARLHPSNIKLLNTIVANNTASAGPDCYGTINNASHNIIENTSGCTILNGNNNLHVDPLLVSSGGALQLHAPQAGSPAINSGTNTDCPIEDQLGVPRPQGSSCDIGSVEVIENGIKAVHALKGNDQAASITTNFPSPFTVLVLDENNLPVSGVDVTFTAPSSGASGTFTSTGTNTMIAATNENGRAATSEFTANTTLGSYIVTASVPSYAQADFRLINVPPAEPNHKYVSITGEDGNPCSFPSLPCRTINGAISQAANGDTIRVTSGTYTGNGFQVVLVDKSITLSGGWDADFIVQNGISTIDGEGTKRGIYIESNGIVIVDRFRIQNGYSSFSGGGIFNPSGSTVLLSNSEIRNNKSDLGGGGVYNFGTMTINSTTISGNSAGKPSQSGANGAGILSNSTIGSLTLNDSTVSGNSLVGNFSSYSFGGGIYSRDLILNNSTVSGNRGGDGSGLYINASNIFINNSTITGHTSHGLVIAQGDLTLQNTIIAGNGPEGDCKLHAGTYINNAGYNLIGNGAGCSFPPSSGDIIGTSNTPINAGLLPLNNNGGPTFTHALMTGSPAINGGNPSAPGSGGSACLAADQRGESRPMDAICDIGAFEGQVPALFVNITGNTGVPGVTLKYHENGTKNVVSDTNGNYSITVLLGWSGVITPSKQGYVFEPAHRSYLNVGAAQGTQNYVASQSFSISGNTGVPGVSLRYLDGTWKTVLSDGNGNYAIPVLRGWSGTITPSKEGHAFDPASRSYTNISQDQNGQNYSPLYFTISGKTPVSGVRIYYTDLNGNFQMVTTDANGYYSFVMPPGWSGTIIPEKENYNFLPVKRTIVDLRENRTAQNFAATYSVIKDYSFENFTPNNYWTEYSTNFMTPLCTFASCGNGGGTAAPRTGAVWAWFGGAPIYEHASLRQSVLFNDDFTNKFNLGFYFWIGAAAPGSGVDDVFTVRVDETVIFSANATQQAMYPAYTPIWLDISSFVDGRYHVIHFSSTTDQVVNFNVDDVIASNSIFFDVAVNSFAQPQIESIYNAGITGGCGNNPLMYCPNRPVTRAQMAVFLLKGIHGSSYTPPPATGTVFADVPAGSFAAAWIEQMVAEGITAGCGGGNFCPNGLVNRAQMAVFLLRAKHGMGYTPPSATGTTFNDVPSNGFAASWIEQLVAEGITSGCGGGNYCPGQAVTRAQMAVFLQRTFNLPLP